MRDLRFTVEQIWLLQRLRGSGLNREQIVAGLEDLDRLDGTCLFNGTFYFRTFFFVINKRK